VSVFSSELDPLQERKMNEKDRLIGKARAIEGQNTISKLPLFQNESLCKTFHKKGLWPTGLSEATQAHFHMKDFAQGLVLKPRRKEFGDSLLRQFWSQCH